MLGQKVKCFKEHTSISLESLVPQNNFYRQVEAKLDLSFVRDFVKEHYSGMGRPSIDPVVFFKLQLIMFFEGIRSERQLMTMVNMRLDHRWDIGYDLDEAVPDHSSLTKIRNRYGLDIFQRFFEQIVERCRDVGLVWGKELYFDGTLAEANADYDTQVPRFYWNAQEHVQTLFNAVPDETTFDRHFVAKYDGHQRVSKASSYERDTDYWLNSNDPEATSMGKFKLGYRTHYVIDGGKARIIVGCLVTPSTIQDNAPMVDLAWWARFRWHLPLQIAVGDARYGTIDNIVALEEGGVRAFVPLFMADENRREPDLFPRSAFQYQAAQDYYICPHGEHLHYTRTSGELRIYRTNRNVCKNCPLKTQCTRSKRGRSITHSIYQPYLERVAAYPQTAAYQKAMRKRQVWVEAKFSEAKLWHQGRRFHLRHIWNVNIEALLRASVQNIKQLLRQRHTEFPLKPANARVLPIPGPFFSNMPLFFPSSPTYISFRVRL